MSNNNKDRIDELIRQLLARAPLSDEVWDSVRPKQSTACLATEKALLKFVTQDTEMIALKGVIRILSQCDDTVLIQGETGTGKELIARALHGRRKPDKFFPINCAGIPPYLLESELFGHVRGAFTSANCDKPGVFKAAAGGTVFLDEIGELPMDIQAKLLRVLQEKAVRRVGDYEEIPVDFRCVCATHHNLDHDVKNGKFREDLYFRISTFILNTKPLKDRIEDIELIIRHLLGISHDAMLPDYFSSIDLQCRGNVRKLQQIVRRYQVLHSSQ